MTRLQRAQQGLVREYLRYRLTRQRGEIWNSLLQLRRIQFCRGWLAGERYKARNR